MSLTPFKDRTIRLTPESALTTQTADGVTTVQLSPTRNFVDRFLPQRGIGGIIAKNLQNKTITLTGPTNLSFQHEAGVAQSEGLFTPFLQPWYIKNIPITIKGQSYLGAYTVLSVPDKDVENLLAAFRQSLNDFSERAGKAGNKDRFLLEISGNPKGARRFLGFITQLNWTEDVKNPYLLDYTLGFLGRNVDNAALVRGKTGASADTAVSDGQSTGG